jgi:hypothetical protein
MRRIVRKHPILAARSRASFVVATLIASALLVLTPLSGYAAGTPEQQCQATKNKSAGKYAACRQSAEAKVATSGDTVKYNDALSKCGTKLTGAWQKAIDKATAAGATCSDAPLTVNMFQSVIDEHTDNIATALAGSALIDCAAATTALATCNGNLGTCTTSLGTCASNLGSCTTDLATCQAGILGGLLKTGQTTCWDTAGTAIACAGTGQDGELQKGLASSYTDNGDGTISDNRTGLMWEKLADDGSIHDKDSLYIWVHAFSAKVAGLNGGGGFAGHTDWRLPNVNELRSLVDYGVGVGFPSVDAAFNTPCGGCIGNVTTCSCTQLDAYWSATSYPGLPSTAWYVSFNGGKVDISNKASIAAVRAVRGGP